MMTTALAQSTPGRKPLTSHNGLLLFVAASALLFLRAPDAFRTPQFWAEDGVVFFGQQYGHKLPPLFTTYAGYLHAIPRLIAWLATIFPYKYAPLIYNISSLLIEAGSISYFAHRSSFLAPAWITLLAFALVPTNGEEFGTIANIQWFLQFALFAICIYPTSKQATELARRRIPRCILLLGLALTGPFSIFCIAIVATAFAAHKLASLLASQSHIAREISAWWKGIDKIDVITIAFGSVIQLCSILFVGYRSNKGKPSLVVAEKLLSEGLQRHTLGGIAMPNILFALIIAVTIASLFYLAYRNQGTHFLVALSFAGFAIVQIISVSYAGNQAIVDPSNMSGDRYYFFMKIVMWLFIASALKQLAGRKLRYLQAIVPLAIIAIALFSPQNISRQPLENLHWKKEASRIGNDNYPIEIPINPVPWKISLTAPKEDGGL